MGFQQNFSVSDESNDRDYFTMLPNYILNHSTAVDQSLYMQMKRYAGENKNGECWASKRTLMDKMGVGRKALDASIAYLLKREWIYLKGQRLVDTKGGPQMVTVYGVRDIWKLNMEHYHTLHKGASRRTDLPPKVRLKVLKGASERAPNKNHINKIVTASENPEEAAAVLAKMKEISRSMKMPKAA